MMKLTKMISAVVFGALLCYTTLTHAEDRIKDIATIDGVRSNQLIGYGLVVGLSGTGDQTSQAPFTSQSFQSMLNQFGVRIPPNITNAQLKNVAAVAISAELPPFIKQGKTIDVTVSSIGNASSLRGGTLLMTPLQGADGQVYAMAQGNVVVSGVGASGSDGSKVQVNVPSVGRISGGATVERTVVAPFMKDGIVMLSLNRPDFTTAQRMADAINQQLGRRIAQPMDASSVRVTMFKPAAGEKLASGQQPVSFIANIENVVIKSAEAPAKITINSRTGTIIISQNVTVAPTVVSHGSLTVSVTEDLTASQPSPLSAGETAILPSSDIKIQEQKNRAFVFHPGASLNEIVKAINKVGATPSDLIAILEALKAAGALDAQLEII